MRREQVLQLLRDGAVFVDPSEDLLATAAHLQQLRLIEASTSTFVWCVNPHDSDYSESDHYCRGRIDVPENMEECFEDFYCPECERPVFPDVDEKERHRELYCRLIHDGIFSYVKSLLEKARLSSTLMCEGVVRVDVGPLGVFVCVADTCGNRRFLTRAWAAAQPTRYILANPKSSRGGLVKRRRLPHILLADLVCGRVDMAKTLSEVEGSTIKSTRPPNVRPDDGRSIARKRRPAGPQQFIVAIGDDCVWVNGLKVVGRHAGPRLEIFRILWELHVEELRNGKCPYEFRAKPVQAIQSELESRMNSRETDESVVRRIINRMRADIVKTVRQNLGLPINRSSIIEICRWTGQGSDGYGYRLNPSCVAIAAAPSEHASA